MPRPPPRRLQVVVSYQRAAGKGRRARDNSDASRYQSPSIAWRVKTPARAHTWRSPETPTALRNHGKRKGDALSARSRTTSRWQTRAAHCSQKARSLPCTAHRICRTAATAGDEGATAGTGAASRCRHPRAQCFFFSFFSVALSLFIPVPSSPDKARGECENKIQEMRILRISS